MMSTTTFGVCLYYNKNKFKMFVSGKSICMPPFWLAKSLLIIYMRIEKAIQKKKICNDPLLPLLILEICDVS